MGRSIDDLSDEELLNEQLNLIRDFNCDDNLNLFNQIVKELEKKNAYGIEQFREDFEAYMNAANKIYNIDKRSNFDAAMNALPDNLYVKALRKMEYSSRKLDMKEANNPEFMDNLDKKLKGEYYNLAY